MVGVLLIVYCLGFVGAFLFFLAILKSADEALTLAIFWPLVFPVFGVAAVISFTWRALKG